MIPRTFLSTYASNGQQQMAVVFLTDITGLKRWADYIPVKLSQGGSENSYANNGYVDVVSVVKTSTMRPFAEYVPVYVDNSASDAWQVNATGYIPYGFAGFGGASMVMDFTNGAALDSRITFTRASTATYFNSSGVLTTTGFNLLTYSEQFDNAAWTKTNSTITANTIVSPDGTMDADKHIPNNGATIGIGATETRVYQSPSVTSGTSYTYSMYAKAGEYDQLALAFITSPSVSAVFSLTLGTIVSGTGATITSVGNGWYRCSLTTAATSTGALQMRWSAESSTVSTGDGTSGIYIWGAQFEASSTATTYIPTTSSTSGAARFDYNPTTLAPLGLLIEESRTNLLTYSEQFDNAAWIKLRSSVTPNTIVAPNGALTADALITDTTANDTHRAESGSIAFTSGTTYTLTLYVKAQSSLNLQIVFLAAAFGTSLRAAYNLQTGQTLVSSSSITAKTTDVGNGWFRCEATATATATATSGFHISLINLFAASAAATSFTGDGTSGIYIWGAQLEAGAFATSYIPTVASQVTRAADSASMTGTNFSSWFNAAEGTLYADYRLSDPNSHSVAEISSGGSDYIRMRYSSGGAAQYAVQVAGVTQASLAPAGFSTPNTQYKRAITYATNSFNQAINGLLPTAEDTSGTVPVSTRLFIGAEGATGSVSFLGGTIRRIAYYPRRLSNAELQGITA